MKLSPKNPAKQAKNREKPVSSGLWLALPALLVFLVLAAVSAVLLADDVTARPVTPKTYALLRSAS